MWIWALTGGQNDLSQAANKGYPADLPADLVGRLDAYLSQRRITARGRNNRRGPEDDGGFAR
jgi:hypothetical protein